jgi:aspartate aminotransferase
MVPGSAFGAPGFMRITYACSEAQIRKGIERTADALKRVTRAG